MTVTNVVLDAIEHRRTTNRYDSSRNVSDAQINDYIQRASDDLLQVEEGSLYPALQRLLKENLLKAEWQLSATNRRVRMYQMTRAGQRHLEQEISRFDRMLEGIQMVLGPARRSAS